MSSMRKWEAIRLAYPIKKLGTVLQKKFLVIPGSDLREQKPEHVSPVIRGTSRQQFPAK